jgi:hypothetical protein
MPLSQQLSDWKTNQAQMRAIAPQCGAIMPFTDTLNAYVTALKIDLSKGVGTITWSQRLTSYIH